MVLTLLAILIAALVLLGAANSLVPRRPQEWACTAAAALMMALAAVALVGIGGTALRLPLGPPSAAIHLALDPLGASFLLLLSLAALPRAVCERAAPVPMAAMALIVIAADGFTLALGLLIAGAALSWRVAILAAASLIVALAPYADFATIRAAPPEGWRAGLLLALVLLAMAALVFASFRARRDGSHAIIGYVLIRVLFDLCGQAQPLWWSLPLLVLGSVLMIVGGLRAIQDDTVLSAGSSHQLGMAVIAIGVALMGRAVDLPSMTSVALAAAWLALVAHALCGTLLTATANVVEDAAGTRRLDRLGGLIHPMPITATICVIGLFGTVFLPPSLGFAGFWLLFQSLLAAARAGGLGLQLLIAIIVALTGLSLGLSSLAGVRLFGVAFLGRPRAPRTAVAEEPPRRVRYALGGLAAVVAILGLLPALALACASGWTGFAPDILTTGVDTPGYSPIITGALLAVAGIGAFAALRARRSRDQRTEPMWMGGFAKPPAWLPFGDPATQYGPISFVEPLRRLLSSASDEWRSRLRQWRRTLR